MLRQSMGGCAGVLALWLSGCAGLASWGPPAQREQTAPAVVIDTTPVGANEYRVRPGDTLYSIAFRHQVDFRELAQWNGIPNVDLIHPNQVLRLVPPSVVKPVPPENGDVATAGMTLPPPVLKPQPLPPVALGSSPPAATPPAARAPAPTPVVPPASGGWTWPTNGVVTGGYAPARGQKGLEFSGRVGQPVVAASAGKVVYSGNALKGYGELIIIKHDEVFLSAYGYNRTRLVKEGDTVQAGQPIAEMGEGPERKPMLHFEIRERGKPVNPVTYLPAKKG